MATCCVGGPAAVCHTDSTCHGLQRAHAWLQQLHMMNFHLHVHDACMHVVTCWDRLGSLLMRHVWIPRSLAVLGTDGKAILVWFTWPV
jgi:hypothetical protein